MDLVIDANIIISALIAPLSKTQSLMFSEELTLFAPEFLGEEIKKHEAEICAKANLSLEEFKIALDILCSRIKFIPFHDFQNCSNLARKISPDPDDTEYIALALNLKCSVWSNDKELKKQTEVNILNTTKLLNDLKIN